MQRYPARARHHEPLGIFMAFSFRPSSKPRFGTCFGTTFAEVVKPPPVAERELPSLQPASARALLGALRGHPLYLLASLALATGMRRNEMLALRWRDVDLDAGRLAIEQSLEQTRVHGFRIKAPKDTQGQAHNIATSENRNRIAGPLAGAAGATSRTRRW